VEDNRSQVWGGATLGLFVGLILGFFVGSYWTTVLYAVLIGAASGVVSNILSWIGGMLHKRDRARGVVRFADSPHGMNHLLDNAEGVLREHDPADFETSPNAAVECIDTVHSAEVGEWWRARYDSIDSFYAAHESRHPHIRVYATVRREVPMVDALEPPAGIGGVIARRIARYRAQPAS
jgi:hypothetical protein